jgi:hypothetical protein
MVRRNLAGQAGEVRQTFSVEAKPRYPRSLQAVVQQDAVAPKRSKNVAALAAVTRPAAPQINYDI